MTTEPRFTKGEWRAERSPTNGVTYVRKGDGQDFDAFEVAVVYGADYANEDEIASTSHLIAAAPDMFEALTVVEHAVGNLIKPESTMDLESLQVWATEYAVPTIRAALKKALGD